MSSEIVKLRFRRNTYSKPIWILGFMIHCLMDEVIDPCMLDELLSAAQLSSDVIKLPPAPFATPI